MKSALKSSFTLVELLIVILIVSLVYTIFVQKISSKEYRLKKGGIQNIRALLRQYEFNESAKMVCIGKCMECSIYVDGKRRKDIEFFTKPVTVYDFDIHGILTQKEFVPIFKKDEPKEVCFAYTLYPNGSASSFIVQEGNKYYVLYAYAKPVKVVDSLDKASELYDQSDWIPTDASEYNF